MLMATAKELVAHVAITKKEAGAETDPCASRSRAVQSSSPEQPYIENRPTNLRPRHHRFCRVVLLSYSWAGSEATCANWPGSLFALWLDVAIFRLMETGIRELKDNLSRYIRRVEEGERVVVTAHGRVVAELVPPAADRGGRTSQFDQLIASGAITPPDRRRRRGGIP